MKTWPISIEADGGLKTYEVPAANLKAALRSVIVDAIALQLVDPKCGGMLTLTWELPTRKPRRRMTDAEKLERKIKRDMARLEDIAKADSAE